MGVSPEPFILTLMVAASASFATPIGYQTNLMVFNVGGYRFGDFVRIGVPLTFVVGLVTVLSFRSSGHFEPRERARWRARCEGAGRYLEGLLQPSRSSGS
jgi:Na+/H+ antiporter NhaD/arsenite permease-like protein